MKQELALHHCEFHGSEVGQTIRWHWVYVLKFPSSSAQCWGRFLTINRGTRTGRVSHQKRKGLRPHGGDIPVPVRSPKSSTAGQGLYLDGDHRGARRAVGNTWCTGHWWRSGDPRSAECTSLTTRILHNSLLQSVTGVWNWSKKRYHSF